MAPSAFPHAIWIDVEDGEGGENKREGMLKGHGTRDACASVDGWRPELAARLETSSGGGFLLANKTARDVGTRFPNENTTMDHNLRVLFILYSISLRNAEAFSPGAVSLPATWASFPVYVLLICAVSRCLGISYQVSQGSHESGALTPPSKGPNGIRDIRMMAIRDHLQ
ncbi:hypothetical protein EDD18DRAFT_1385910 [Armillaria luteobubalina]|uniref:Uncharacterized protein n=1 Tax=Armillaria luteobubalina TaxID=153913 RepID=A0AA39Q6Y2_9AGAR|nr:hypothetical protein EDD18DRAFT_1385910 [Armillaria luteobubalina]